MLHTHLISHCVLYSSLSIVLFIATHAVVLSSLAKCVENWPPFSQSKTCLLQWMLILVSGDLQWQAWYQWPSASSLLFSLSRPKESRYLPCGVWFPFFCYTTWSSNLFSLLHVPLWCHHHGLSLHCPSHTQHGPVSPEGLLQLIPND